MIAALVGAHPGAAHATLRGNLALHVLALRSGVPSAEAVEVLLQENPHAVRIENGFGNIALHYLCSVPRPNLDTLVVRTVMKAHPEGVIHCNRVGKTPLDLALSRLRTDVTVQEKGGTSNISAGESGGNLRQRSCSCPTESALRKQQPLKVGSAEWAWAYACDEVLRERTRLLLRSAPKEHLSEQQRKTLRHLNWIAREPAFCVARYHALTTVPTLSASEERTPKVSHGLNLGVIRDAFPGVWRNIVLFL